MTIVLVLTIRNN